MVRVLDVIEDALGSKLNSAAVAKLDNDPSDDWLVGLWKGLRPLGQLSAAELRDTVPVRSEHGLQPYLPFRIYDGDTSFVGDIPVYEGVQHVAPTDRQKVASAIGRHCLYCNRVVLDDPMWWVVCDMIGPDSVGERFSADDRQRLAARRSMTLTWLHLFAELRPLLASDRLVLLPPPIVGGEFWWAEIPRDIAQPPAALLGDPNRYEYFRELVGRRVPDADIGELGVTSAYQKAIDRMAIQVKASAALNCQTDISPVTTIDYIALTELVRSAADPTAELRRAARSRGQTMELQRLVALPAFLDVGDDLSRLVDLAADDDGFNSWRSGLGRALQQIEDMDQDAADFEPRARNAFRNELAQPVEDLSKARAAKTWKGAILPSVSSVGISGASTAVTAGIAVALGMAATAPVSVVAGAAIYGFKSVYTYARGGAARHQGQAAQELFDLLT